MAHKERLKKLKTDVHVLTLTATPIPRTLQMALSGVREMSLIATPPVDRLAVRTFVLRVRSGRHPRGDPARARPRRPDLLRLPAHRGPRRDARRGWRELVPEVTRDHGARPDGGARAGSGGRRLLRARATTCCCRPTSSRSASTCPAVNTIVIHRADMFGLAQLYQLRGRVGRGKLRAYAYLTLPPRRKLTRAGARSGCR